MGGGEKKKRERGVSRCTWVMGKKRKEKIKKREGDIKREERESEKENGKGKYFGSCEKNK